MSIMRLKELEVLIEEGGLDRVSKKEGLSLQRDLAKLERSRGGIKHMDSIPDALFIVDVGHEKIAVSEAVKLGIPVVAVVDTNNPTDGVDYIIPGNDDAIRSIELYVTGAADAILEGREAARLQVASAVGSNAGADTAGEPADAGRTAKKKRQSKKKAKVVTKKKVARQQSDAPADGDGAEEEVAVEPSEAVKQQPDAAQDAPDAAAVGAAAVGPEAGIGGESAQD